MHTIRLLKTEQHDLSDHPFAIGWSHKFPKQKDIQDWVESQLQEKVFLKRKLSESNSIKTKWDVYDLQSGKIGKVIRFKDENLK